jgi:hypothetical protein
VTDLFAWQRAVIASSMPRDTQLTALRLGLDSAQGTGREVVINAGPVSEDVGCSERTVWRRVQDLVDGGWLLQTAKPTYTGGETRGRRARYRLLIPGESSATPTCGKSHDPSESCDTPGCGKSDDFPESPANPTGPLSGDDPSRVPNQPQSSDTTTADDGTLSPSDGLNNSSSSGDVAIDILASKLRRFTALASLRTDKLRTGQATEIVDLIEVHGDQKLVDNAVRTLRRDDPPQTIQAFLPGWRVMPKPGDPHLAAVPDPPCPGHGHTGTTKHCNQCASEQKAASR